ncbi:MAG: TonB family protein [Candidatus Eisenbacteria bacterium]|nr:TonB family protein [Candidatus Eisenbacteria bacterium]
MRRNPGWKGWMQAARAWLGASLWRRTLVASTALHVVGIAAFSVTLPSRTRPMLPPVYYVSLAEPPPRQDPAPPVAVPQKTEPSPVKVEREREPEPDKQPEPPPEPPETEPPDVETAAEPVEENLQIQTDQPSFAFNYYLDAVRRKISSHWHPPAGLPAGEERVVVLHFRVLRDGTVLGPAVESSSGFQWLDESAAEAVRAAVPLPPLPPAYDGPWLGIHLRFVRHE